MGYATLFKSNFPDAGSWPLPASWDLTQGSAGGTWTSPNVVHSAPGDDLYSVFKTPFGANGGKISMLCRTAGAGLYFYFQQAVVFDGAHFYGFSCDPTFVGGELSIFDGSTTFFNNPAFMLSAGSIIACVIRPIGANIRLSIEVNGSEVANATVSSPVITAAAYPAIEPFPEGAVAIDFGSVAVVSVASTAEIRNSFSLF